MKNSTNIIRQIRKCSYVILSLALISLLAATAYAEDGSHSSHTETRMTRMEQIKTQAEAEALKPGDSIAMVCSMCKYVTVHPVRRDDTHVKMMTVGNSHTCALCGGKVAVVGTGKGTGKHEEVKHVCSKCGDEAMFVVATKPGSGHKHVSK